MATEAELMAARAKHGEALGELGPFPNGFRATVDMMQSRQAFVALSGSELVGEQPGRPVAREALPMEDGLTGDEPEVWLFGRVVAKRGPFLVIRTPEGDGQALVRADALGETDAAALKVVDLGDHAAVRGPAIRTRTGAAAVRATHYQHVGKALLPPPAKWHGLKDVEKRYRERYVDLFANPRVGELFRARSTIVRALRDFLQGQGFLEVETPLLHSIRGGATAKPFSTHHNTLDLPLYLRVAPELYLKRLLVGGLERVFEIGRCFRNEGVSTRHNPEFTILEYYQAYANCDDLMDNCEAMLREVSRVAAQAHPTLVNPPGADDASDEPNVDGDGTGFRSFDVPFHRVTMRQSILDRVAGREGLHPTGVEALLTTDAVMHGEALEKVFAQVMEKVGREHREALAKCTTYGSKIYGLFEALVEPHLTSLYRSADGSQDAPVFITEFPIEVSPLARRKDADPQWVDRFELFVDGKEVANAFSELNDPEDQAGRFQDQLLRREGGDEEAMDFDADYVRALRHGMPPAAGFGLGVDRLVMLMFRQPSIREVLLFPLLRPAVSTDGD